MSNLTTRVLVAVIAIPLIVAASYLGGTYFFLFTTALIVISTNEFYSLAKKKNLEPLAPLGIILAGVVNAIAYAFGLGLAVEFMVLMIAIVLLYELSRKRTDGVKGTFENVGSTLTGIFYIGFFGAILTTIRQRYGIENVFPDDRDAGLYVITIFATIWICDSAAYFVGKSAGKHKMSKFVSPNKTWEGAIAGFVFATATPAAAHFSVLRHLDMRLALGTGIIVGILGQAGDFVESLFKRDAGAKDSSEMIPGHGGVLDRFDSLLFSAPFIYLMLKHFQ
ncbi:MAG TPA: phosphatidate cytidylyltransferase [Candidatus Acidoferrales bacterium]|nr:phosphatidate cytidylyltransferase [Candidatus Acidoferrales bacterium]